MTSPRQLLFLSALFALVALLSSVAPVQGLKEGDYIDSMKRSRLGADGVSTEWSGFPLSQLPRFKVEREVVWHMLDMEEVKMLNSREFKIQLSFDRGLLQTPWLTLYSYNPLMVLRHCDIVFVYSGSVIVDMKIYPEYTTISELQSEGGEIIFSYRWSEYGEHDVDAAYMYLFGFPVLLAVLFTFKILTSGSVGKAGRDLRA